MAERENDRNKKVQNNFSILNLFFTGKCNLNCHYCFINEVSFSNSSSSEKNLKKTVDLFFRYPGKKKVVSFNGGEPLLEFLLVKKICDYAKKEADKKGISVEFALTTNGTLLNQNMVNYFEKNKFIIKISIDGDKDTHDKNRIFRGNSRLSSFDRIIKNIEHLEFRKLNVGASMVLAPNNINGLLENIKFLNKQKFYSIDFYPDLYANWKISDLAKIEALFRQFSKYYIDIFQGAGRDKVFKNSFLDLVTNNSENKKIGSCEKLNSNVSGDIYICDKIFSLESRQRKGYIIGDINGGIDEKLRQETFKKMEEYLGRNNELKCGRCKYFRYCFCPFGHYVHFLAHISEKNNNANFWKSFCFISKAYINTFLAIKNSLKYNSEFVKLYRN